MNKSVQHTRGLLGALAIAWALCLALAGCSGADGGSAADATKSFVATWEITGMTSDGEETSSEDLELIKSLGTSVYLTLTEDGKATLELFGVATNGTWEAKDATTAVLKLSDGGASEAGVSGDQELKVADGTLSMEGGTTSMSFERIDPADKVSGSVSSLLQNVDMSDLGSALESVEGEIGNSATSTASILGDTSDLDITVADDEVCTIRITAKGDYYGDPGYVVSVTNNGKSPIKVDDNNEFYINDAIVSPIFSIEVGVGETKEEVLWFESSELDGGVAALNNVSGALIVSNAASEELGTYYFEA